MAKEQLNARISALTRRQLDELGGRWGTSQTETLTVIIDRMYQQESKTMSGKTTNDKVINSSGKAIDYESAVNMMNDDLRERLHNSQDWHSNQAFFSAYETAHQEQYGEEWELSKENPVW